MTFRRDAAARAFTLMETVIAIGVLAVLITAFLAVFGPATKGIRRSINVQDADRLVATLEKEMSILRPDQSQADVKTAFDKAFQWIEGSGGDDDNLLIMLYQYRGDPNKLREDGTMEPSPRPKEQDKVYISGRDFVVQSMARRRQDDLFVDDLEGLEGRVFVVKTRQLVYDGERLVPGEVGEIRGMDPQDGGGSVSSADDYPDAVIAFNAEFYSLPSNAAQYLQPGGFKSEDALKKPMFTRNLGVRR